MRFPSGGRTIDEAWLVCDSAAFIAATPATDAAPAARKWRRLIDGRLFDCFDGFMAYLLGLGSGLRWESPLLSNTGRLPITAEIVTKFNDRRYRPIGLPFD